MKGSACSGVSDRPHYVSLCSARKLVPFGRSRMERRTSEPSLKANASAQQVWDSIRHTSRCRAFRSPPIGEGGETSKLGRIILCSPSSSTNASAQVVRCPSLRTSRNRAQLPLEGVPKTSNRKRRKERGEKRKLGRIMLLQLRLFTHGLAEHFDE